MSDAPRADAAKEGRMPPYDDDSRNILRFPTGPNRILLMYLGAILAGALVLWFVLGGPFYVVEQDEQAVVLTLGMYSGTSEPGPHFKLPWPIQTVIKEKVTHVRRIEIGFRTTDGGGAGRALQVRDFKADTEMLGEAQMLTGDENIVNIEIVVQYEIASLSDWLFNSRTPEVVLRWASESVLRQVVGDSGIDEVLILNRVEIGQQIRNQLDALAKVYGLGVRISGVQLQEALPPKEVVAAFKEVATAKEESSKLVNQAMGYRNEKEQHATGQASRIRSEAEGYLAERVALAEGESKRFTQLAEEAKKNPDLLKERIYLETMARILPKMRKVFVDKDTGVLNLNHLDPAVGAAVGGGHK
jgi:membrane protease subunit HflK